MLFFFLLPVLAAAISLNDYPPQPQSTVCGDIVNDNLYNGSVWFDASSAIACLTSVPFNSAVATRFINYWNQTLQFQSTTAYVRNPPAGYQRPAFDIPAALAEIQRRVDTGYYHNQYAFEADLQRASLNIHDSHTYLFAGIFEAFSFSIPYYLYSASTDGKALPEVYVYEGITSAAIATIGGTPVVQWLDNFASQQAFGFVEANADWNQIMLSPAQFVIGSTNPLTGGGTFYFGDELDIVYKDNTTETWDLLAYYNSPGFTGPLETGGDFYNFFVLGLLPANYDDTLIQYDAQLNITDDDDLFDTDTCGNLTSWYSIATAYPNDTLTYQPCLGLYSDGSITSYYFGDISTAVLSIPTFVDSSSNPDDFNQAISDFLNNATDKGAKRVIIDLQQNNGGQVGLAYQVVGQFFPQNEPFGGSRMRYQTLMNELGTTLNGYFSTINSSSEDYDDLIGDEFVVTDRLNAADNENFPSWQAFAGPVIHQGDTFSLVERYNLSDTTFLADALGIGPDPCYYGECKSSTAFEPEDIILLTDGTCASTCTLFVELMTERGVRSVVVGGRPENGPMQTASGSRGAAAYSGDLLDDDVDEAQYIDPAAVPTYNNDTGMVVDLAGITLRDQIRENDTTPLQFLYLPANCRIFWTLDNVDNYTRLWHDAYNAIYGDTTICVPQSTNASPPAINATAVDLPRMPNYDSAANQILHGLQAEAIAEASDGNTGNFVYCDNGGNKPIQRLCGGIGTCQKIALPCGGSPDTTNSPQRFVCIPTCRFLDSTSNAGCPTAGKCRQNSQQTPNSGKFSTSTQGKTKVTVQGGSCVPDNSRDNTKCSILSSQKQGNVPLS